MIKQIVSLKDVKAREFLNLVHLKTKEEAQRFFVDLMLKSGTPLYAHPRDYQLWRVAEWDTEVGVIVPCDLDDWTPYGEVESFIRENE